MADVKMPKSIPCKFEIAWQGKCGKPTTDGWCTEHEKLKCRCCGKKATRDCDHARSLVCGVPLCDTCRHSSKDGEHVTREVYQEQVDKEKQEELALKQSRTNPQQLLDGEGNPVNLFELFKRDPADQGYQLKIVFSLQLNHDLMGYFPAVIHQHKRVIRCLDRHLMIEIWKTLSPRESRMESSLCYVNEQRGSAYSEVLFQARREGSKLFRIFTREEFEKTPKNGPGAISWAPGLFGGNNISQTDFPEYVDKMAALCQISQI